MKMLSSAVFWGVVIILIGLSFILKGVFNIQIPVIRLILGVIIIYFGIRVISGGSVQRMVTDHSVMFGKANLSYMHPHREYSIVFSEGSIDLTALTPDLTSGKAVRANVVFGDGQVYVPRGVPVQVELSTAFGSASAIDKSVNGFGSTHWQSEAFKAGEPYVRVKASAVFGQVSVVQRKQQPDS